MTSVKCHLLSLQRVRRLNPEEATHILQALAILKAYPEYLIRSLVHSITFQYDMSVAVQ